jgi:hypothetical protein
MELGLEFRLLPVLTGSPPEAPPPIPKQKNSPRQTNEEWEASGGARAGRRSD